MIITVVAVIIN